MTTTVVLKGFLSHKPENQSVPSTTRGRRKLTVIQTPKLEMIVAGALMRLPEQDKHEGRQRSYLVVFLTSSVLGH